MPQSILITQCLQNDFVKPVEKYDPLPNALHVGYDESRRLLGEIVEEGPVCALMRWAYAASPDDLTIVNIRDWHDADDHAQDRHLASFGRHCVRDTEGADFVFAPVIVPGRASHTVNATGLNDFAGTDLAEILEPYRGRPLRVGLAGVWTEAKITFLAYELVTRFDTFRVGVSSALTASSSREMHFIALEQLANILGVEVFASPAGFIEFLAGAAPALTVAAHPRIDRGRIAVEGGAALGDTDRDLLLYLFRSSGELSVKCLDGGFSGNVVVKTQSRDLHAHRQVPCVIKIGPRDLIAKERMAFERIQDILGNNAPAIVDFCESGDRGAIKYRYASMLDGAVRTLQELYAEADAARVRHILEVVFVRQLGRLYEAAYRDRLDLLRYYDFSSRYAAGVRRSVEAVTGRAEPDDTISLGGATVPNPCRFYERDIDALAEPGSSARFVSYLHGDLNGRNIIVDEQENVWLIDFFHTHRGHVLRDLIKLENDLLYIWTPVRSDDELDEAFRLSDLLIGVEDLAAPLPEARFAGAQFQKAWETARVLRSFYPALIRTDRDPYQLHAGLLRYAVHTLSFDEPDLRQKRWALYSAGVLTGRVRDHLTRSRRLRIDYLALPDGERIRVGMTILPGRRDWGRDLAEDLDAMREEGVSRVLALVTQDELVRYGVPGLIAEYGRRGIECRWLPVLDQGVPTIAAMRDAVDWIEGCVNAGEAVLIHCVGGLGRTGAAAACYLARHRGLSAAEAVAAVRRSRSGRAVESREQSAFIERFAREAHSSRSTG